MFGYNGKYYTRADKKIWVQYGNFGFLIVGMSCTNAKGCKILNWHRFLVA
jgi:hypothetical protein